MAHVKTSISLDETLFREADEWAEKLGVSRSQFFARAVEEYVREHENEELLRRLNEAHADGPDEEDEEALRHVQALHVDMLRRDEREGRLQGRGTCSGRGWSSHQGRRRGTTVRI